MTMGKKKPTRLLDQRVRGESVGSRLFREQPIQEEAQQGEGHLSQQRDPDVSKEGVEAPCGRGLSVRLPAALLIESHVNILPGRSA